MDKVLVSFNESNYNFQKDGLESCASEIQEVVNQFNNFGFTALATGELQRVFTETNDLFFDKITNGQPLSIGGLDIDKTKALEIIKKPAGYENFLSSISSAITSLQNAASEYKLHIIKNFSVNTIQNVFEFDEKSNVIVKPEILNKLKSCNTLFAETPTAIKIHELALLISEKCKEPEIAEVIKSNPDGISMVIKSIFKDHVYNTADVFIDGEKIVKYNQPGYKF